MENLENIKKATTNNNVFNFDYKSENELRKKNIENAIKFGCFHIIMETMDIILKDLPRWENRSYAEKIYVIFDAKANDEIIYFQNFELNFGNKEIFHNTGWRIKVNRKNFHKFNKFMEIWRSKGFEIYSNTPFANNF